MQQRTNDLRRIMKNPLFSGMQAKSIADALRDGGVSIAEYASGEAILPPDTQDKPHAGILLSGKASVFTTDPSKNTLLRFLNPCDAFGVANLFSDSGSVSIIRATVRCRVLILPGQTVRQLIDRNAQFRINYLRFLSDRICYLNRKIRYLTAGSAERKLALYLASFGTEMVALSESISSLSDLLDLGRASLYRAFDRLISDGFLMKDGKKLTLFDVPEMLRTYSR